MINNVKNLIGGIDRSATPSILSIETTSKETVDVASTIVSTAKSAVTNDIVATSVEKTNSDCDKDCEFSVDDAIVYTSPVADVSTTNRPLIKTDSSVTKTTVNTDIENDATTSTSFSTRITEESMHDPENESDVLDQNDQRTTPVSKDIEKESVATNAPGKEMKIGFFGNFLCSSNLIGEA